MSIILQQKILVYKKNRIEDFKEKSLIGSNCLAWQVSNEFACSAGDAGDLDLTPGSERSPGGGHGNPLQHSS